MIASMAVALWLVAEPRSALAARGGPETSSASSIKWEKGFDQALKKARRSGKPVMVHFWADWCGWCEMLERKTYVDQGVVQRSQEFVWAKINTEGSKREVAVATQYEVTQLPTILFLSPEGRQIWRVNAFQGPGAFPRTMDDALIVARSVIGWEQALARDAGDAHALAALGAHLYDTGARFYQQHCLDEASELLRRAVSRDADQPLSERRHTRMQLAILQNAERNFAEAERLVKDALSLAPRGEDEPKLLFVLGRTYMSWGRADEGRATMEMILRQYPFSPVAPKARETIVNLPPPR